MRKLMLIVIVALLLATPVFAKNDPKYINNKSIFIVNKNLKTPITEKFLHHNIMMSNKNKVYVWGWNRYGQLALGDKNDRYTPTENKNLENIIRQNGGVENIQGLYFGCCHNVLIFKNGKVYVWGYNYHGELGLGDTNNRNTPTENANLENIINQNGGVENIYGLYVGAYHNILIFKNGKVYVWGGNNDGQLGLGDKNYRITPTENHFLENVIQQNGDVENIQGLYVGWEHNILIFKNGKVYVWGWNQFGQLGLGDTTNRNTPTENTNLENVIQQNGDVENIYGLYVGAHHNVLIFKNGKVYVWGWNHYGQLSLGDTTQRNSPTENTNLENIINQNGGVENIQGLYVGVHHNILIFKNGKVYVCGWNRYGQLGLGDYKDRLTPTENTNLENIIQQNGGVENIQGLYVGCCHNILIFKNGKVYFWGGNDAGQLGLGDTNNRNRLTENANLENIIRIDGFPDDVSSGIVSKISVLL